MSGCDNEVSPRKESDGDSGGSEASGDSGRCQEGNGTVLDDGASFRSDAERMVTSISRVMVSLRVKALEAALPS